MAARTTSLPETVERLRTLPLRGRTQALSMLPRDIPGLGVRPFASGAAIHRAGVRLPEAFRVGRSGSLAQMWVSMPHQGILHAPRVVGRPSVRYCPLQSRPRQAVLTDNQSADLEPWSTCTSLAPLDTLFPCLLAASRYPGLVRRRNTAQGEHRRSTWPRIQSADTNVPFLLLLAPSPPPRSVQSPRSPVSSSPSSRSRYSSAGAFSKASGGTQ